MKRWLIGGLIGACVGVGMYLLAVENDAPKPSLNPPTMAVAVVPPPAPPAPPSAPLVLAEVIDVTDLDSLLDPPTKPATGVPFDAEPVAIPATAPTTPERILPAVD